MTFPNFRKISTKVMLSIALIVLFQGMLSIATLNYVTQQAIATSLDDQRQKTRRLIEQYFSNERKDVIIKADLLAGQARIVERIVEGSAAMLRGDLDFYRSALNLDSVLVIDGKGDILVDVGRTEIGDVLVRRKLVDVLEKGQTSMTAGEGNRLYLWGLHDIAINGRRKGVLGVAVSLDRNFIGKIEEISNTSMLLTLRGTIPVNGRLDDQTYIEYDRRITADPQSGESGKIGSFLYSTARLPDFPELEMVYFIDTGPSRDLLSRYVTSTLIILAIVLIVAFCMSLILYRYSFLKPFNAFQDAIRKISRGDLSFRISRRGEDEFADLEREFEKMTTSLRKLEQELQISSRMAAIGEMVAGVAHQIRNPLAIMKVSAELIRENLPDENGTPRKGKRARAETAPPSRPQGNTRQLIEMIAAEINSLSSTVASFLDFARPLRPHMERVDLKEFLTRAVSTLPVGQYDGCAVSVRVDGSIGPVCLDITLMEQLVHNLVINGLQASPSGGEVLLSADRRDGRLRLRVKDVGRGMSEEVKSQIFHPFFTTKSDGTGLGLSIVHRIVEEHGGTIDVRSQPGEGTEFEIMLQEC